MLDRQMLEALGDRLQKGGKGAKAKGSMLWKVPKSSDRQSRMRRLSECRKEAAADGSRIGAYRDRMNKRQEVELAQESFARYFPQKAGNPFDGDLIFEAMADFGIKARTRPEKLALIELVHGHDKPTVSFGDFCSIIEDAKARMRQLYSFSAFQAWRVVDVDERGALSAESVLQIVRDLGLVTSDESPESFFAEAEIANLPMDEAGLITFYEAEFAIEELRLFQESTRRRKERDIRRTYELSDATFKEFRMQLLELHSSFDRLDEDNNGYLDSDEVVNLLAEFGFVSPESTERTVDIIEHIEEEEQGEITFPAFLKVIKELRMLDMHARSEEVLALFKAFDRDRSGELDMRETSAALVTLGLQPRTVREQQGIAQLLEEVDADGSGMLCYDELLVMVQRIAEHFAHLKRKEEGALATKLNFSPPVVRQLRSAYEALCTMTQGGSVTAAEVERAFLGTGFRAAAAQVHKKLNEGNGGASSFCDFLRVMAEVDADQVLARKVEEASRIERNSLLAKLAEDSDDATPAAGGSVDPAARRESTKAQAETLADTSSSFPSRSTSPMSPRQAIGPKERKGIPNSKKIAVRAVAKVRELSKHSPSSPKVAP